jgi:amino acid adenylation domain-containing protein
MNISALNDNDLDLLDLMLEDEPSTTPTDSKPPPGRIERQHAQRAPLSFQQQRLWFLHQLTDGVAAYNICTAFRLSGPLAHELMTQAFDTVISRHDALRTAIREDSGEPEQVVLPFGTSTVELHDWLADGGSGSDSDSEVQARLEALARHESAHCFDLANGQPLRIVIVKLAEEEHALVLTLHHIISDAWSLGVFMNEVAQVYAMLKGGHAPRLPELSIQYTDYAIWQRRTVNQARWDADLEYWKTRLAGLPLLELPTDRPRPRLQTFDGAMHAFTITPTTTTQLKQLAIAHQTTLFCVLLTAFQALLARHSRQDDIPVGISLAGRESMETEALIGFFANMLVIRGQINDSFTFRDFVQCQSGALQDAVEHAAVPYDRLVEALDLDSRDPSRNPLFQVAFTLLNIPSAMPSLAGLQITPLLSQEACRFDLELFMRESENGLSGAFSYNTALFDRISVERIANQLGVLLDAAAANPDCLLSQLPLMAASESAALLTLPLQIAATAPEPLQRAFMRHAALRPQAIALRCEGQSLSYGQLDELSDRAARALIGAGVVAGEAVGLWLAPSFDMLIGILAVLKAGAGYVPLDPVYPSDRISYILENSGVGVVLSNAALAATLPPFEGRVLRLDDSPDPATQPVALPVATDPQGLAYIIYTSGSTGRPKGVAISHLNAARLFTTSDTLFDFDQRDVWTLFHSYAFDFSVWEIWGALAYGGTLVIVPPLLARSADAFYQLLCDERVTVLSQTPSAFRQLMAAEEQNPREGDIRLRYVVFGGEALELAALESWIDRHGDEQPQLINMYGITETTVHVTFRRIGLRDIKRRLGSVIGTPLPDLCIRLLDPLRQPVPAGMVGEMYVGGAGVALCYVNNPGLSAERFLPDDSGLRFYRSGDLARITPRGDLEYCGRADQQVKLRGFRIETAEIQSVLVEHPSVADAAVVLRGEGDQARLVAYVVARTSQTTDQTNTADWQPAFDMIYEAPSADEVELDIVGWTDSYDNAPIPTEDMRQWRDEILLRIKALKPRRLLEIGVGSGMLLLAIAPQTEFYCGLDFSQKALERIGAIVTQRGLSQVELHQRGANELDGLANDFDTIICNSVAQYFPDPGYFMQVVEAALARLAPGGQLLLGDLRHLGLLRHFQASRLLHFMASDISVQPRATLRQRLAQLIQEEKELLVDPVYFRRLAHQRGDISEIKIRLKEHGGQCELTTYRYDVVLTKSGGTSAATTTTGNTGSTPVNIDASKLDTDEIVTRLAATNGRATILSGIANQRCSGVLRFLSWLDADDNSEWLPNPGVSDIKAWSDSERDAGRLLEHAAAFNLSAHLSWTLAAKDGSFDLALSSGTEAMPALALEQIGIDQSNDLAICFNTPAKAPLPDRLGPVLREHLAGRLPTYMIPAAFVQLERLPLNHNGKLDVRALPEPGRVQSRTQGSEAPPTTPAEHEVARVWAEVLGLSRIGRDQNFFEAGGHSLLATQVMSRLRATLNVQLPLRTLFEHPTVAQFAAMLAKRVDASAFAAAEHSTPALEHIPVAARTGPMPPSFAQQRFWFLERLNQGDVGIYNIAQGLRLRGQLNEAALRAALAGVVRRHEALRTRFALIDDQLRQIVDDGDGPALQEISLSRHTSESIDAAITRVAGDFARLKFDMEAAPPVRFGLLRVGTDDAVLLISLHHAMSDGWSLGVLIREFSELYSAALEARPAALPPLAIQYGDYAQWQRQQLSGARFDAMMARWTTRLADAPTVLQLQADQAPGGNGPRRGKVLHFDFSRSETDSLRQLAERNGCTLFMVLLTGYASLLSRYSGAQDIVVGTPIANRNHIDLEGLIGCFVNTLALRVDLSGTPNTQNLLARVRDTVLEAYELQDMPFETIVDALNVERSMAHNPLFQVMLVLQNTPTDTLRLPGLEWNTLASDETTIRFDLTLTMQEDASGLHSMLEYDVDMFRPASAAQLVARLKHLLLTMAQEPGNTVARIDLLTPAERNQLLCDWANGPQTGSAPASLLAQFEACAQATPDAEAVVCGDDRLSYAELNSRANRLAHHLIAQQIGPEDLVALAMTRSAQTVVALLAVLKAGAAYVPLDLDYPPERLAYMLADAKPRCVLSDHAGIARLPETASINLDDPALRARLEQCATTNPEQHQRVTPLLAHHPAYVIYTSGSTGQPKGVLIQHANLHASTAARQAYYPPDIHGAQSVFLMLPSFSFDSSVATLFWSLASGGKLVIPRSTGLLEANYLSHLIAREKVSVWLSVPSLYRALTESAAHTESNNDWSASLQLVLFGGEPVSPRDVASHGQTSRRPRYFNEYGPTEATVWCSVGEIAANPGVDETISIGKPIANTQIYILDEQLEPVPIGISGSLYIAGAGLARGYLHRPDLTAQRFIDNPFSPGQRMYLSGDLAKWRADGQIDYLGRNDEQLKIRGFRIEPGEIEAALETDPGIARAVVIAREDRPGQKQLVGYLVAAPDTTPDIAAIRQRISASLPEHMVPAQLVLLDKLPLSPNGKLNRAALPAPDFVARTYRAPGSAQESTLAALFAEVLGLPRVGIDDPFFDIGGNSLLTLQLVSRIKKEFHVTLPLAALFTSGTVAQLSQLIDQSHGIDLASAVLQPLRPNGTGPTLLLVHDGSGQIMSYHKLVEHLTPPTGAQPRIYGLQASGLAVGSHVDDTISAMATRYAAAVHEAALPGPFVLIGHSFGAMVAAELACHLANQGATVQMLAVLDAAPRSDPGFLESLPLDEAGLMNYMLRTVEISMGKPIAISEAALRLLEGEARLALVTERVLAAGIFQSGISSQQLLAMFNVYRANLVSLRTYVAQALPCPVHLWATAHLAAGVVADAGWSEFCSGPVVVHSTGGDHISMLREPHVAVLARSIAKVFEASQGQNAGQGG